MISYGSGLIFHFPGKELEMSHIFQVSCIVEEWC